MTARLLKVSPSEYLADSASECPTLSSSIAHTLVTRSARHAWLEHPRLGGKKGKSTAAMDEGSILHRLILGKGAEFELVNAPDYRSGWAREIRDEIRAQGRIPILTQDFERLGFIADRVRKRCDEEGFGLDGESELPIEFHEKGENGPVLCRAMIDHVRRKVPVLLDLKKVATAHPQDLERRIVDYGYDIQAAAYSSAYEKLYPQVAGRSDFVFLFCETDEEPFEVVPARLDPAFREIGRQRWLRAVQMWEQLLASGSWPWPGYSDGAVTLIPPNWVLQRELGNEWAV